MDITLRYNLQSQNDELLKKVNDVLNGIGMNSHVEDGRVFAEKEYLRLYLNEDPDKYFFPQIKEDCHRIFEAIKSDFVLTGVIDTSFSAGEYMDFRFSKKGEQLIVESSDWYIETCMETYKNYEDFCENFFDCTEAEYEKFKNSEFVNILETENGEILSDTVPFVKKEIIGWNK